MLSQRTHLASRSRQRVRSSDLVVVVAPTPTRVQKQTRGVFLWLLHGCGRQKAAGKILKEFVDRCDSAIFGAEAFVRKQVTVPSMCGGLACGGALKGWTTLGAYGITEVAEGETMHRRHIQPESTSGYIDPSDSTLRGDACARPTSTRKHPRLHKDLFGCSLPRQDLLAHGLSRPVLLTLRRSVLLTLSRPVLSC